MSNTVNISAIVVLYNPNLETLNKLYQSLFHQINLIIFVDNSPIDDVRQVNKNWIYKQNNINNHYLSMNDNLGIAIAQNRGIEFAKKVKSDFVLLLDQDSTLTKDTVENLVKSWQDIETQGLKVAAIGPSFMDEKTGEIAKIINHKGLRVHKTIPNIQIQYEISDYIISSGSLLKIQNFDIIGLMQEDLFIDWVDIEWGLRAKMLGFQSYVVPTILMKHSIGDEFVDFNDKKINLHSDFRNYFIVRNSVYLSLYSNLPINFRIIQLSKTPLYIAFYSYHSTKPLYSLKLLLTAVKDGIIKNMGKGYFRDKGL